MTLQYLAFAAKHPDLSAQIAGTLAKNPSVLEPMVHAAAAGSFAPVAAAITANASVWSTVLQQILAYVEANPQILGDLVGLLGDFLPKA